MEFRQLRYFVAIVNHGSVSKAAQALFVAQSALSKQMAELERELDCALLDRHRTGVQPTEAGRVFYDYSLAILKQAEDAVNAVHSTSGTLRGQVDLAIPQSIALALALPLSLACSAAQPSLRLNLNEELTVHLIDQLSHGRVDFCIHTANNPLSAFQVWPLAREELCLVTPAGVRVKGGAAGVDAHTLATVPMVLSSRANDHCLRAIAEAWVREKGHAQLNVVSEINSVTIIKSAVLSGLGYTLFPRSLVEAEVKQGLLATHRIGRQGLFRELVICASRSLPMNANKWAILALVHTELRRLCASGQWPGARYIGAHPPPTRISPKTP